MRVRVRRVLLLCVLVAAAAWLWMPVCPTIVLGESMAPTLHNGQVVLLDRTYYRRHPFRRGDIVVFRHQGVVQVKRVYALPGAHVWEVRSPDGESAFLADLSALPAAPRSPARTRLGDRLVLTHVPPGTLYVIGDGGNRSCDSRYYGPILMRSVLGRVRLREETRRATQQAVDRASLRAEL